MRAVHRSSVIAVVASLLLASPPAFAGQEEPEAPLARSSTVIQNGPPALDTGAEQVPTFGTGAWVVQASPAWLVGAASEAVPAPEPAPSPRPPATRHRAGLTARLVQPAPGATR